MYVCEGTHGLHWQPRWSAGSGGCTQYHVVWLCSFIVVPPQGLPHTSVLCATSARRNTGRYARAQCRQAGGRARGQPRAVAASHAGGSAVVGRLRGRSRAVSCLLLVCGPCCACCWFAFRLRVCVRAYVRTRVRSCSCPRGWRLQESACGEREPFVKIGTIQRRVAWPLRKDGTHVGVGFRASTAFA